MAKKAFAGGLSTKPDILNLFSLFMNNAQRLPLIDLNGA